jgi:hypothetical protein
MCWIPRPRSASWQFDAALKWANIAWSQGRWPLALEGYAAAVHLLPSLAWLGMSLDRRSEMLMHQAVSVACDAAACAIQSNAYEQAVELLDQGRSFLWAQASDLRLELEELRSIDGDLASDLERVAKAIEQGTFEGPRRKGKLSALGDESMRLHQLATEWDYLLKRVRNLPQFHDFLEPIPFPKLRLAAGGGPVVIVNISKLRCDALIIQLTGPILHVPLPDMTHTEATKLANDVGKGQHLSNPTFFSTHFLFPVLRKLWTAVVSPIIRKLDFPSEVTTESQKPRLWWCPTGPLTVLPIHAAGPYSVGQGADLMKQVVSSYTTTLSALARARSRNPQPNVRIMAVSQVETPGQRPLPNAAVDVSVIRETMLDAGLKDAFSSLEGVDATVEKAMGALKEHSWAHFACHGQQNLTTPMDSSFFLNDGPLQLSAIALARLPLADFAFLSACNTATGTPRWPDEAIHLAAGLQFAGFRSLIASMWSVADEDSPKLCEIVYHYLLRPEREKLDSSDAAFALNKAILHLRKEKVPLYRWVPFIHIGV